MQLGDYRESSNTESRGGGGGMVLTGGLGTVALAVVAMFFGIDPRLILGMATKPAPPSSSRSAPANDNAQTKEMKSFMSKVLATTEDCWTEKMGGRYTPPKLVFFEGSVQSACGLGQAAMGPFYCGEDRNVFLDLSFFQEMKEKLGAPGDFAQGYVVAHEVGHHVQNLLGTLQKVHEMQRQSSKTEANQLSVRLELQADYYAGVWGNYVQQKGRLETGDLQEALSAATAIGDDRLQKMGRGYVVPDSFTHGTSDQRYRWFRKGFETGDPRQGDTFNASNL